MKNGLFTLKKARFYFKLISYYMLTLAFMILAVRPATPHANANLLKQEKSLQSELPALVAGKPVRIVIPDSKVDLIIDDGFYTPSSNTWTLSGTRAHFAHLSSLANNQKGLTLIYGHNNNNVFGALRKVTPNPGALAYIYTENGKVFEYAYESVYSVTPNDTSALSYEGPPILTILTCTGSLDEWRTLYKFNFVRVL